MSTTQPVWSVGQVAAAASASRGGRRGFQITGGLAGGAQERPLVRCLEDA